MKGCLKVERNDVLLHYIKVMNYEWYVKWLALGLQEIKYIAAIWNGLKLVGHGKA